MVGLPISSGAVLLPGVSGLFLGLRPFHLQPQLPIHIQQSQPSTSMRPAPIILKDTMDQFFTTMAQTQSTQSPNSLHSINQSLKLQADQDGVESPQRRMTLPACAICGADSTGIHFGSEACAACSAFFRRTVVLNKQYICPKNGKCLVFKDAPGAQKCRACRFTKCIRVGMDRGAVQQRRDAIGKYSAEAEANRENGLKRDREPDEADDADASSTHDSTPFCATASSPRSPKSPKISSQSSVLDEFITQHEVLNRRRKLFYTSRSLSDVFDESAELEPVELSDFAECMFQLWQIEPRLAAEFISTNRHLSHLPAIEKSKLLKNFMLLFQAVEEPYLTWKFCGFGKDKWMMPNRTYIDFKNIDYYYMTDKCIKGLNLDKETARSLFIPSFQHALDVVGSQMAAMDIGYTELVALASILLLDPCISGLDSSTKDLCFRLRNQIIKDLFVVYQNGSVAEEPEVRLGMLINIISGIKVHAIKSMENMLMLKTFDICPRDKLFDEIVGIHG